MYFKEVRRFFYLFILKELLCSLWFIVFCFLQTLYSHRASFHREVYKRVSMGLTVSRKIVKNLAVRRKNC